MRASESWVEVWNVGLCPEQLESALFKTFWVLATL